MSPTQRSLKTNTQMPKMPKMLSQTKRRFLRGLAHKLKPVIMLGKAGYSENVHDELEIALNHHELVKIKLNESDRSLKDKFIENILTQTRAQLVQKIGQILVIYRQSENKIINFDLE